MRVGIMTFWESQNNYGQLLQAFALQTYLEKLGNEVFVIRFRRIPPKQKKTVANKIIGFKLSKYVKNRLYATKIKFENQNKPRKFDLFREKYIKFSTFEYSNLKEIYENPPEADIYISGSDQVWNNSFPVSCEPFLLGFAQPGTKRISYAASFGKKSIKEQEAIELFETHLKQFDAVSVREESGVALCKELGYEMAYWVPDPTLLFNKHQWSELLNIPNIEQSESILLYTLGNSKIKDRKKYISHVKALKNVDVFHISANNDFEGNIYPDISKWVEYIASAKCVLTNSFHGIVFSIIFNRNFIILPNTGGAAGMNERILSLLSKLELMDRISLSYDKDQVNSLINSEINWVKVNAIIEYWLNDADSFLKKHIS